MVGRLLAIGRVGVGGRGAGVYPLGGEDFIGTAGRTLVHAGGSHHGEDPAVVVVTVVKIVDQDLTEVAIDDVVVLAFLLKHFKDDVLIDIFDHLVVQ